MVSLTEEPFYVEPPYHYRPAVVELLVKLRVTTAGFVADLLYLDHKKSINIERYSSDSILLKLVSKENLHPSERSIWDFLILLPNYRRGYMLITRDNLASFDTWEYMKSLFSPHYELKSVFEYDKVSQTVKLKNPYGDIQPAISHTYYTTNIHEPLYTPPSKTSFLDSIIYRVFLQNKEFKEHRNAWLNFKDFVCKYSELEDKSLQYYELWGEFYYYALAVGAIKNPFLG